MYSSTTSGSVQIQSTLVRAPLMARPASCGDDAAQHLAGRGLDVRLLARAAQDGGGEALRVAGEIDARHEAAHRVTKDHVGAAGVALVRELAQGMDVLDQDVGPGVEGHVAQLGIARGGLAVADVVVGADNESLVNKVVCKGGVALDMLGHAVDELHDRAGNKVGAGGIVGLPHEGADGRGAVVAGIGKRGGLHEASCQCI